MASLDADYFDDWYSSLQLSQRHSEIQTQSLGLPPELESTSLLPWDGIAEVIDLLALEPGTLLVDLGCGRGGYGLEMITRTDARLVGVDFSAVAIARALDRAGSFGLADRARFVLGDLTDTGLDDSSVDAVVCVDAVQFAEPPFACIRECFRILRPGGRLVVTCWEAADPNDESVSARLRQIHLGSDFTAAGFIDVVVENKVDWSEAERAMWTIAAAETVVDDPGLQSMKDEGIGVLARFDQSLRVCASGVKPAESAG